MLVEGGRHWTSESYGRCTIRTARLRRCLFLVSSSQFFLVSPSYLSAMYMYSRLVTPAFAMYAVCSLIWVPSLSFCWKQTLSIQSLPLHKPTRPKSSSQVKPDMATTVCRQFQKHQFSTSSLTICQIGGQQGIGPLLATPEVSGNGGRAVPVI